MVWSLKNSLPERPKRFLRHLRRIARSFEHRPVSQPLPIELIEDCRFCASRLHMLHLLPQEAIVAELGTQTGAFAREIVARARPRELHVVDRDYSVFDPTGLETAVRHQGDTAQIVSGFAPNYFDWIYIDADHSFDGVMRDICASASKVRPGGYLVFNDFAHADPELGSYGVHRAVTDFMTEARWPLRLFAYEVAGLYDVAIQRP
jgi:predicted O-methyltransferase YrrM